MHDFEPIYEMNVYLKLITLSRKGGLPSWWWNPLFPLEAVFEIKAALRIELEEMRPPLTL